MYIPQRDIATAEAAKLVLSRLQKVLSDTKAPCKLIQNAIIPVFGIRWDAAVYRRVTRDRLCSILYALRNSKLDKETYRRVALLWSTASETISDFPHAWSDWRVAIERFNLDDEIKLPERVEIIDTYCKRGWSPPQKLALAPAEQVKSAFAGSEKGVAAFQLWSASALLLPTFRRHPS